MANAYCIGVDIGGTTVKMGMFHVDGRLEDKWEIATSHADAGSHILEDIAHSLQEYLFYKKLSILRGLGLACPGPCSRMGMWICVSILAG